MQTRRPLFIGAIGSLGLLLIYAVILTISESFLHAVDQFIEMWPWILLLSLGFGIQLGLYSFIRIQLRHRAAKATAEVAASGGLSTAVMIACCAHHLVDVLPLLGLSAAAIFLAEYQLPFLVLGIASNIVGIFFMLLLMQKHGLRLRSRVLKKLFAFNLKKASACIAGSAVLVIALTFIFVNSTATAEAISPVDLDSVFAEENFISFEVVPVHFAFGDPLMLEVRMNTHQVDLGFDLVELSQVETDTGSVLTPLDWDGDGPGGHHRSGLLAFPPIMPEVKEINFVVKGVADVPERIFTWKLK